MAKRSGLKIQLVKTHSKVIGLPEKLKTVCKTKAQANALKVLYDEFKEDIQPYHDYLKESKINKHAALKEYESMKKKLQDLTSYCERVEDRVGVEMFSAYQDKLFKRTKDTGITYKEANTSVSSNIKENLLRLGFSNKDIKNIIMPAFRGKGEN